MEEIGYPEILSEETDLHKIEKMLEGYDLREFQSSQYVGQAPIDTSMQPEDMFAADFYAQKSVSEPFNIFFTFVYIIGTVFIIIGAAVILLIWINNKKEAKSS